MIKLIIFDNYGVFLKGGYPETCKALAKKFHRDWREILDIVYFKYANLGAVRKVTQQEAWQQSIDELDLPITVAEIKKIHFRSLSPNKPMIAFAKSLKKKGYTIFLLSKNMRSQFTDMKRLFPEVQETFGKSMVNTYEYNLPKASKETLLRVFDRFGITDPGTVIYIDDQEENLKEAKEMGVHTIFYRNFSEVKEKVNHILNKNQKASV